MLLDLQLTSHTPDQRGTASHELVNSAEFNKNLGAHLGGFFNVMRRFANIFVIKKPAMVSLSSIYGSIPPKFQIYENTSIVPPVEYSAIKGGIENLTILCRLL